MPPQRREELLLEFERSGLPATKFAQLAGVRYQTFATWGIRCPCPHGNEVSGVHAPMAMSFILLVQLHRQDR